MTGIALVASLVLRTAAPEPAIIAQAPEVQSGDAVELRDPFATSASTRQRAVLPMPSELRDPFAEGVRGRLALAPSPDGATPVDPFAVPPVAAPPQPRAPWLSDPFEAPAAPATATPEIRLVDPFSVSVSGSGSRTVAPTPATPELRDPFAG